MKFPFQATLLIMFLVTGSLRAQETASIAYIPSSALSGKYSAAPNPKPARAARLFLKMDLAAFTRHGFRLGVGEGLTRV